MEYLYKEMFASMIKQNVCEIVDDYHEDNKMLLCVNEVLQMKSAFMELVFPNDDTNNHNDNVSPFKLFISYNELFTLYDNKYKLNIKLNKDNNSFIIGTSLFTNYISIFNYPNTSISFFSISHSIYYSSSPHSTNTLLIINILKYSSLLLIIILLNNIYIYIIQLPNLN